MDYTLDSFTPITKKIALATKKFDVSYWRNINAMREFPDEYWNALATGGLFGILIGKKWGGMEKGLIDLALAVEETAERYSGIASYLYLSGSLVSAVIAGCGNEEQKLELLPKFARGELKASIALGEESSGFDALSIETVAKSASSQKNGNEFLVSGSKTFVNNVDRADYLIVFARTAPTSKEKKSLGISMFLVDAKATEIKTTKLEKLGWDFVKNFNLKLEGVKGTLLGELDHGWYNILQSFNMDRVATSASLVGTGKLALSQAASHAKDRIVFGKQIGSNQGIQFPLADAYAELETSWVMTLKAASLHDLGRDYINEANYSLLTSSNAAMNATDRALQSFGGHGYYKEYDVERYWRDVRVHRIHPISEELLLASISERSLGLPRSY